jgi:peptidoglycan/xylan/chitin deacetylase (PgdA/CDA1 family)
LGVCGLFYGFLGSGCLGFFAIELGYFVNSITHKRTKIKEVALTFDDGPTEFTPKFLDLLQKHQVKATFFCIGKQIEKYPETFQELLQKDIPLEIIRCPIPIQQVFYLHQK